MKRRLFLYICALTLSASHLYAGELIENHGFINVTIDNRLVRLEQVTVKRSDLTGKLPIALITHGTPESAAQMRDRSAAEMTVVARDLALRGWLAVGVDRRGFGGSDGPAPSRADCASPSFVDRFVADADDLQAALIALGRREDADPTRIVAIGASTGGAAVLALAARNPKGLQAVINVSGGMRLSGCNTDDRLVAAFKTFGTQSKIPTLWLYAQNDSFFGPELAHKLRDAFVLQGGDAQFVMFEPLGNDGHAMFYINRFRWLPELDAFLRRVRLPTWQMKDAVDFAKHLKLGDKWRSAMELYLSAPAFKAMSEAVIDGGIWYAYGYNSLSEAKIKAVSLCQSRPGSDKCDIVMENQTWLGH